MDSLKYVVTDVGSFAIFSPSSNHRDVAAKLYGTPAGAGFCRLEATKEGIKVEAWGYSVSMGGLESRKLEDAKAMERGLNNPY